MAGRNTVTNEELGRKLDEAARIMQNHMDRDEKQFDAILSIFNGDNQGEAGIKTRLDRAERTLQTYTWSLRALWLAVLSALAGTVTALLTGGK